MLPNWHLQTIAQFQHILEQLQASSVSEIEDVVTLKKTFEEAQQVFDGLMKFSQEGLDPSLFSIFQSYVTETHKQMRLLQIDLRFLQASRQSTTTQQRLAQVRQRITILISYSQAMLENG